ncbi:MAG: hypothetical protein JSV78_09000 [Phycisphaerales bacterium]|nr:MAG: hypothetical protein JSV78_09000 [Phycisphaerales bacterium]
MADSAEGNGSGRRGDGGPLEWSFLYFSRKESKGGHYSTPGAPGQVREDLAELLNRTAVERARRELGHRWQDRQLDPHATVHLFMLQVFHQNAAVSHLPHLAGEPFSASGYCQARQRLLVELSERLVDSFTQALKRSSHAERWLWPGKPCHHFLELVVNRPRPGRVEPRCLKRQSKSYPLLTRPRKE